MQLNLLGWNAYEAAMQAAEMYRYLRKRDVTIRRPNDCLIACFALNFDVQFAIGTLIRTHCRVFSVMDDSVTDGKSCLPT